MEQFFKINTDGKLDPEVIRFCIIRYFQSKKDQNVQNISFIEIDEIGNEKINP